MLIQTDKTHEMNLSLEEEASLILNDLFDGDQEMKTKAISEIGLTNQEEIFKYIIEHEDDLYDLYLPIREIPISDS
jgi:hypothetical protein